MARPDRIDVELFHQHNVPHHRLFGHIVAGNGIMLVPIYSLNQNRLAIDQQLPVQYLDLSKTNIAAGHLDHPGIPASALLEGQHQAIQIRLLRGPLRCVYNCDLRRNDFVIAPRMCGDIVQGESGRLLAAGVKEFHLDRAVDHAVGKVANAHFHLEDTVPIAVDKVDLRLEVPNVHLARRPQKDISEYSA